MRIIVTAPEDDIEIYLEHVVLPQYADGYTSGHQDSETHWTSQEEGVKELLHRAVLLALGDDKPMLSGQLTNMLEDHLEKLLDN